MRGMLTEKTTFIFETPAGGGVSIKGQRSFAAPQLFKERGVSFEKMGIGGLDNQFEEIFRRAFQSRALPASLAERLGVPHVKGVLLHGPPGTGALVHVHPQSLCVVPFNSHPFRTYLYPSCISPPPTPSQGCSQSLYNIKLLG